MSDRDEEQDRARDGARRDALIGAAAWLIVLLAAGAALQRLAGLGELLVIKVLVLHVLASGIVLAWLRRCRPRVFGPANQVTLARVALVAGLLSLLGETGSASVAWIAAITGGLVAGLDGVDGWLARRTGTAGPLGARFDMETDAALVLALSLLAWQLDQAGPWVLLSGLMRYLFVAAGALAPWLRRPLPPSRRRQAVCVAQVLALLACIAPVSAPPLSHLLAGLGLTALSASFLVDVRWLMRHSDESIAEVSA